MNHITRHGFTLIELLILIAMIGVLLSLSLPAVQFARVAARRAPRTMTSNRSAWPLHNSHPPGHIGCPNCGVDHSQITNASSLHPRGVNVVRDDGSVRFVKDSIRQEIW